MPSLGLYLLGPFQVNLDDTNITASLRTEKERALLTYVVVESDHPHTREAMAELFWPERPEGVARTNLRQALLGVRRAIGDRDSSTPYLLVDDTTVRFNLSQSYWLDTEAFNNHIRYTLAHTHKNIETCLSCAQHLQAAVDLYRGDFLSGLFLPDCADFQEWIVFQREQYFRYLLSGLQTLSDYFQNVGDFELAHKYARRLVSLDPLDESAHRRLMRILSVSGRRAAALEQYQTCRRILLNEFGVEPSPETVSFYEKIKNGDTLSVTRPVTGSLKRVNLPTQFTSFVGRQAELDWLHQALTTPSVRLITIVGIGGIGKTRLALQAAEAHGDLFSDGIRFISLDTLGSPDLVVPSIALAFGLSFRGDAEPKKQLIRFLMPLSALLVIDGIEDMLNQIGLILEILQQAPSVKVIITSRQRLNYQAATQLELKGLGYPVDLQQANVAEYPAVQLFLSRATRSNTAFVATEKEFPHIIQICKLVDGLPLAIELAAARLREFSCEQIAKDLQRDINILQSPMLDMPERHRSIRAVFDQNWKRLSDMDKAIFRRLAVFQDGFTLEAAQAVAGASLPLLSMFMDFSLLKGDASHGFSLHPLLKHYASEKLAALPEENERVYDLHSQYYFSFLQARENDLRRGVRQQQAMREIEQQIENIRSALARASYRKRTADLSKGIEALKRFYDLRNQLRSTRPLVIASGEESLSTPKSPSAPIQSTPFKVEIRQLLELLSRAQYTDREVFLRELIANASAALTRMEVELLNNRDVLQPGAPLFIRITANPSENILTITDQGVGMSVQELKENLSTLHAGARSFLETAKTGGKHIFDVIGQFGVGFFSTFMVADWVRVISRPYWPTAEAAAWFSQGEDTFTVAMAEKANRGTTVIIKLKADAAEFLQQQRLVEIIRKHSNFIPYPIYVGDPEVQANLSTVFWRQPLQEIERKNYAAFYRQFTLDFEPPLAYRHSVETTSVHAYTLLYIPSRFDRGLFSLRKDDGLRLYARKVLIQDYCKDLLPDYFRFVQGVVDSDNLSPHITPEAAQASSMMPALKKYVTAQVIHILETLAADDKEAYERFWKEFGRYIKESLTADQMEHETLPALLRFHTTTHPEAWVSLDEYVARMKPEQQAIYYILSDDERSDLRSLLYSPQLDVVNSYGYEVLLMLEPVDAFMLSRLLQYQGHSLINVTAANLKMPEPAKSDSSPTVLAVPAERFPALIARFKKVLKERIIDVRVTTRVGEFPARLLDPENMPQQELQRAYSFPKDERSIPRKILELNPYNPILVQLDTLPDDSPLIIVIVEQVFENTLLLEGLHPDPAGMIGRIQKLMEAALAK